MNHEHEHNPANPAPAGAPHPDTPDDAGSQALAEALRSSFAIVQVVMVVLVIVFLGSGFFTVGQQEQAIILRFGKPVGEGQKALLGPGLHWSFPYPIDEIVRIPISELQSVTSTIGWYAVTPEQELSGNLPPPRASLDPAVEGYVITGDANIIQSRVTLYYRIENPIDYVFNFVNASNAVQDALNNALLYTTAHFKVDDILYREVEAYQEAIQRRVAELISQEQLPVAVDHCAVEKTIPPRYLKPAFDKVTTARENQNKLLNDAHTYANKVLIDAGAQAATITNQATADKVQLVKSIAGDAERFNKLLPKYESNPGLFKQVYLVNAMGATLTNLQDKIYFPNGLGGETPELRLLLNREPPKPKIQTTPSQ